MNSRILPICGLALVLAFLSGCIQRASKSDTETAVVSDAPKTSEVTQIPDDDENPSDAAFKRLDTEQAVPAGINLSPAVSDVVKLATAGMKEDTLLAYVDRSDSTFNLGAGEIIYLNDLGMPSTVVNAMIKRDAALRNIVATADESPAATEIPQPTTKAVSSERPSQSDSTSAVELGDSDSVFREALSPYGRWVEIDGYGECWLPAVASSDANWQPYFDAGHWVYVDAGWYWASDYSWGWAPFHYGRWFHHRYLGWCWEPDPVWGPAWVSWRYNDDSCGWAPLPPSAKYTQATGLVVKGHSVGSDYTFGLSCEHYAFIPFAHFRDRELRPYMLPRAEIAGLFNHTRPVTRITGPANSVINHGIPPTRIAFSSGLPVETIPLANLHPTQPLPGRPGSLARPVPGIRPQNEPQQPPAANPYAGNRPETYPPNSLVVIGRQPRAAGQPTPASARPPQRQPSSVTLAEADYRPSQFEENPADSRYVAAPNGSPGGYANQWPASSQPTSYHNTSARPAAVSATHTVPEAFNAPRAPGSAVGQSSSYPARPVSHSQPADRYSPPPAQTYTPAAPVHQPPPEIRPRPEPPPAASPSHNHPAAEPPPPPRQPQPESHPAPPPPPAPRPSESHPPPAAPSRASLPAAQKG